MQRHDVGDAALQPDPLLCESRGVGLPVVSVEHLVGMLHIMRPGCREASPSYSRWSQ